jgi:hypothetical protein
MLVELCSFEILAPMTWQVEALVGKISRSEHERVQIFTTFFCEKHEKKTQKFARTTF